jgi:hypothetical protein
MKIKFNTSLKASKESVVLYSFLFSGVTFGIGNFDSFPWHVVFIFLLCIRGFKVADIFICLSILLLIFLTALVDQDQFDMKLFLRQILNYLSIIVGGSYLYSQPPKINKLTKIITIVLILNIIISILQNYSEIFTLFSNARFESSGPRGTVGLFSEPTAFGLFSCFCFLYSIIVIRLSKEELLKKNAKNLLILSLVSVAFANQSSTAVMIILVFLFLNLFQSFKTLLILTFMISYFFISYLYFPETRLALIITLIVENDLLYLLAMDGSINERLSSVVGPYFGLIEGYFLPNSTFGYHQTYLNLREYTDSFFWWGGSAKIMNYIGTIMYELSVVGLLLIYRYVFFSFKGFVGISFVIIVLFYLNNSVPLLHGYPLLLFAAVSRLSSLAKYGRKHS